MSRWLRKSVILVELSQSSCQTDELSEHRQRTPTLRNHKHDSWTNPFLKFKCFFSVNNIVQIVLLRIESFLQIFYTITGCSAFRQTSFYDHTYFRVITNNDPNRIRLLCMHIPKSCGSVFSIMLLKMVIVKRNGSNRTQVNSYPNALSKTSFLTWCISTYA